MVRIDRSDILPERQAVLVGHRVLADVLTPLAHIRPVQIEHDIDALCGTEVHNLLDQGTVRLAFILLPGGLAEPAVLRQRQADVVDVPLVDRGFHRLKDVPLTVARPFHTGAVDAAQEHRLVLAVENLRPDDLQRQRHRAILGPHGPSSREQDTK